MFGVGLHFSLKDLMAVKSIAIPGAIAQIAVATLLGMALSAALGWSLMTGIVFGLCLSTASTVVLLRALEERQLIDSQRGQIAIGWLIVEDLVMVLTLVLLPAIAGMAEKGNVGFASLALDLGITIGKVVAFIAIMMLVGRRLVPWIMSRSAATGSRELFTLSVLATLAIIIFGKSAAAFFLVRMFGHSPRTALTIAASLAQIGEFAFILAGLGMALNLLPQAGQNLVLAGAIISIMLNPVLFTLLEKYLDKTETLDEQTLEEVLEDEKQVPVDICNHALLVGFGRVGSLLGEKLMAQGIPLVVVETSRTRVDELRERGISAVLGNAANEEIMELAHLDCARWLLLTIPNGYEAGEIVASAREKCPNIEIIARAHYDDEVDYIIDRGANQVVMGEREIARAMLRLLETPPAGEVVTG
ncbi:Potassium/proton antiporter RosB [Klebsiella pneumoniae]|nr:Potassium/proton antiporter RosB [Klebsiella pneumoniae]